MKRIICLTVISTLLWSVLPAGAQDYSPGRSIIDISGGPSLGLYSLSGEKGKATGNAEGSFSSVRITTFINDNLGFYARIAMNDVYSDEVSYFGALNKADGDRYLYRFQYGGQMNIENNSVQIGASWRENSGRLSYTWRAGIGVGDLFVPAYSYEQRLRDGSDGPRYTSVVCTEQEKDVDYLMSQVGEYSFSPMALQLSLSYQVSYRLSNHFSAFAEVGADFAVGKVNMQYESYGSKKAYEPANYVEAVAYAHKADSWIADRSTLETCYRTSGLKSFLHLDFGIAFEFGNKRR